MWEKNTFKLEIPVWNQEISNDSDKCFPSEKQSLVVIMSHIHGFSTFHDATKKKQQKQKQKNPQQQQQKTLLPAVQNIMWAICKRTVLTVFQMVDQILYRM